VAALGGPAEVLLLGQGDDVAELGEGHGIASSPVAAMQSNGGIPAANRRLEIGVAFVLGFLFL
jgi:hypothetical protein